MTRVVCCVAILAAASGACTGGGSELPTSPTLSALLASPSAGTASMVSGVLAIGPELPPLNCGQEGSLKATATSVATQIEFVNLTGSIKSLYWISYTGQRYLFSTMLNEWSYTFNTYLTHPWVVADDAGMGGAGGRESRRGRVRVPHADQRPPDVEDYKIAVTV